MTHVDTGVYGAKVQSWRVANPRALLKEIIDKNPRASRETILASFSEKVRANEEMLETVIEAWGANNYNSLIKQDAHNPLARRAQVEEIKAAAVKRIRQEAAIILMDMQMPTGKRLRDCNAVECKKAGGWHIKIAAKLKPGQTVGSVFSESQLRKLFSSK